MPKTKRQKIIDITSKKLHNFYGVHIEDTDIIARGCDVYLSTRSAAQLVKTSYHNFSNAYVDHLLGAGVTRIIIGRRKFYKLSKLFAILDRSHKKGISVLDMCRELKNKQKRKVKRRKSNARP